MLAAILIVLTLGSERIEIQNGRLPAPGQERCVRLHASGHFEHAKVRVNDLATGELENQDSELDITGYLSLGAANTIVVRADGGTVERVWVLVSPLVYIARARRVKSGELEVIITNTTENTAQVEIGDLQFTVSPGTSVAKQVRWPRGKVVRMSAVSDGLDRRFADEADIVEHE
jgi:hypothetical protein